MQFDILHRLRYTMDAWTNGLTGRFAYKEPSRSFIIEYQLWAERPSQEDKRPAIRPSNDGKSYGGRFAMDRKCQVCGARFRTKQSKVSIGKGKFCSRECYWTHRRKASAWRMRSDGAIDVELTSGQWAIIDATDLPIISRYKWNAHWCQATRSYYAIRPPRKGDNLPVNMARLILNAPSNLEVDHINHDTLDNRRANIRLCTGAENIRNVRIRRNKTNSKYKGVCRFGRKKRWEARIGFNGDIISIGYFDTEIEAAHAYNAAAI